MWGESKLAKMACLGSLTPPFINNDYVTAETVYSTARVHHEVLTWSQAILCGTLCRFHLEKLRRVVRSYVVVWLLHQPGENKLICNSYAPRIFFQLLSS